MKRKCTIITWDFRQGIQGIRAETGDGNGRIKVVAAAGPVREGDVAQRLRLVRDRLGNEEVDYVLVGGELSGSVVFDLRLPKLAPGALAAALGYELPCLLPKSGEDYVRSFRVVNAADQAAADRQVRVELTPVAEWERLLADLTAAGIEVDAVVNPWLAVDPVLGGKEIYWPALEPEYVFTSGANGMRQMAPLSKDDVLPAMIASTELAEFAAEAEAAARDERFQPALVLAKYALDGHFALDRKMLAPLPVQLHPQRCVKWRRLAVALGVMTFILFALLAGRSWHDARTRYGKIAAAQEKVDALLAKQQKQLQKNLALEKTIKKIVDARPGSTEIPIILTQLTKKLPAQMWITNFRSKDQSIDLTITTKEDSENILAVLSEPGMFVAKNLRKQRSPDGSTILQLFLESGEPENAP